MTTTSRHLPDDAPLSPAVARAAAGWFARLSSGEATAGDEAGWRLWLAEHPEHARAWQRVEALTGRFGGLPAGVAMATLGKPADAGRRRAIGQLAVLLMVGGGVGWGGQRTGAWERLAADHATGIGEQRQLLLADGSRLVLNSDSALDVVFTAESRLLRLRRGEVWVQTGHGPEAGARPFLVETGQGLVRALGTRFSVHQLDGSSQVAVFESAVEITPAALPVARRVLQAGEQTRFDTLQVMPPGPLQANQDAWIRGMLFADEMPLGEFIAELARHRRGILSCDPAVAGLRISGAYPLADTEQVLDALAQALPVRLQRFSRYWVSVRPA